MTSHKRSIESGSGSICKLNSDGICGNIIDYSHSRNRHMKIWLKSRQEQKRKCEDLRQKALIKLYTALDELKKRYGWNEIYIFGSVSKPGFFHKNSDIDIGVSGLDSGDLYRFTAELSAIMERNVDIVRLEESKMADAIRRKGEPWHRHPMSH